MFGRKKYPDNTEIVTGKKKLSRRFLLIGGLATGGVALAASNSLVKNFTDPPHLKTPYGDAVPPVGPDGKTGSYFAATFAATLRGEIANGWCPSKWINQRHDTCGFDVGEAKVLERLVLILRDNLALRNSTDDVDPDLDAAVGYIYSGKNLKIPFLLNTPRDYKAAATHIEAYNLRVANGKAGFYAHNNGLALVVNELHKALGNQFGRLHEDDLHGRFMGGDIREAYGEGMGVVKVVRDVLVALPGDLKEVLHNQTASDMVEPAITSANYILNNGIPDILTNSSGNKLNDIGPLAGEVSSLMTNLTDLQNALGLASAQTPSGYTRPQQKTPAPH